MSDIWVTLFAVLAVSPFLVGLCGISYWLWVQKYRPAKAERWKIEAAKRNILEAKAELKALAEAERINKIAKQELANGK
jgi:cell division protein FtsL